MVNPIRTYLRLYHDSIRGLPPVTWILAPAAAGAVAELLSVGPLDDNLTVSLVAGGVAAALGVV